MLPGTLARGHPVFANHRLDSSHATEITAGGKLEIGIRPEFVSFSDEGIPVAIDKVEDLGRYQVVTVRHEAEQIKMVVDEDQAIPAESPKIQFQPEHLHLYRDDWAVESEHA